MGRKRVTAAKKRVLRSATARNIEFLVEKVPELQSPPSKKKVSFHPGIDVKDVETGDEHLVTLDEQLGREMGRVGSDTDDDEPSEAPTPKPTPHPIKPMIRTYRRRITIDELLEDWDVGEQENRINSGTVDEPFPPEPVLEANDVPGCSCGMAEEAKKYRNMYEALRNEMEEKSNQDLASKDKILKSNAELTALNAKLQSALTSKLLPQPEAPFKDVKGDFLDTETIRLLSTEAETDYLFIKFLMMRLWPEGFIGRSVTGRRSNNPCGRSKAPKSTNESGDSEHGPGPSNAISFAENAEGESKRPLEKDKVDFIISCLYRRRMFLQDDANTAQVRTKAGISLMTRVIANSTRK